MYQEIPVRCHGVSVFILRCKNGNCRTLLLKRADSYQGVWCQVAGKIEKGETAWQGALREVKEETGLVPDRLYSADICEQFYEIDKDAIWLAPVFVAYVSETAEVIINHEHSDFAWFTFQEAMEKFSFAGQRRVLKHIIEEFIEKPPVKWLEIRI